MTLLPLVLIVARTPPAGYATGAWPWVGLGLLLLASGVATWFGLVLWTSRLIHHPPRLTPPRAMGRLGRSSPLDLDLDFEEFPYEVKGRPGPGGGGAFRGVSWWIPCGKRRRPRGTCVLAHGYGDSRSGALPWARLWHDAGFHVLLPDLRAHGESGPSKAGSSGGTGGGIWERDDLHELLDELKRQKPAETATLVLAGASFGALVAAATASGRDDLAAVVLDSPVFGWRDATRRWSELFSLPPPGGHRLRIGLASWLRQVDFDEANLDRTLPKLAVPLLLVLPRDDSLLPQALGEQLVELAASKPEASVWRPETTHNASVVTHREDYLARLETLFNDSQTLSSGG